MRLAKPGHEVTAAMLLAAQQCVKTELDELTEVSVVTETLLKTDASWDGNVYPAYSAQTPELSVVRFTLQSTQSCLGTNT